MQTKILWQLLPQKIILWIFLPYNKVHGKANHEVIPCFSLEYLLLGCARAPYIEVIASSDNSYSTLHSLLYTAANIWSLSNTLSFIGHFKFERESASLPLWANIVKPLGIIFLIKRKHMCQFNIPWRCKACNPWFEMAKNKYSIS